MNGVSLTLQLHYKEVGRRKYVEVLENSEVRVVKAHPKVFSLNIKSNIDIPEEEIKVAALSSSISISSKSSRTKFEVNYVYRLSPTEVEVAILLSRGTKNMCFCVDLLGVTAKTVRFSTYKSNKIPESINVSNGTVKAMSFLQVSDVSLKQNIKDIEDAISVTKTMIGYKYKWKNDNEQSTVIGFIAQEIAEVFPEVVYKDKKTGYLTVSYSEILPILLEALNQLRSNISSHKSDIRNKLVQLENASYSLIQSRVSLYDEEKTTAIINNLFERNTKKTNNFWNTNVYIISYLVCLCISVLVSYSIAVLIFYYSKVHISSELDLSSISYSSMLAVHGVSHDVFILDGPIFNRLYCGSGCGTKEGLVDNAGEKIVHTNCLSCIILCNDAASCATYKSQGLLQRIPEVSIFDVIVMGNYKFGWVASLPSNKSRIITIICFGGTSCHYTLYDSITLSIPAFSHTMVANSLGCHICAPINQM